MKRAHGQKLDLAKFADMLEELGLPRKNAKKLFKCFDPSDFGAIPESRTEDNFKFLMIWDPESRDLGATADFGADAGSLDANSAALFSASAVVAQSPMSTEFGAVEDDTVIGVSAPALEFAFEVVLSREEYNEYLRRRRFRRGQIQESHGVRQGTKSLMYRDFASSSAATPGGGQSPPMTPSRDSFAGTPMQQTAFSFAGETPMQSRFADSGRIVPPSPGIMSGTPAMSPRTGFSSAASSPRVSMRNPAAAMSPRVTPRSPQQTPRQSTGIPTRSSEVGQRRSSLGSMFQMTIP